MKIDTSSYIFTGLSSLPLKVAMNNLQERKQTWIAAAGVRESAAEAAMRFLNDISVNNLDVGSCFAKANEVLNGKADVSAAGVVFNGEKLFFFNTGNARGLFFRKGSFIWKTDDQTEAYAGLPKGISAESVAYDMLRSADGSARLTRAIGRCGEAGKPVPYGEGKGIQAMNEDAFVICTAAFWQYLNVLEMEIDYRKSATADEWLRYMTKRVLMNSQTKLDNRNFAVITGMVTGD